MENIKDLKIAVVCGGISSEREVSLRSGQAVYEVLTQAGFQNAYLFDWQEGNITRLAEEKPDIVYITLHGIGGEDGRIQGFLESCGIPYTGPGLESSAVCMNKILTKQVLQNRGVPTPSFHIVSKKEFYENKKELLSSLTYPVVVKSPKQGSSIGVIIVSSEEELLEKIDSVYELDDEAMFEEFVEGVELTVPVLGNDELTILPIIEITSENEFYDFESKYTPGMCHHIIPARISEKAEKEIREIAEKSYRVLKCSGLSRIDFMLSKSGKPYVIEVNTSPGMTAMSLFPDSARCAGISFPQLCETVLKLGLEKKR